MELQAISRMAAISADVSAVILGLILTKVNRENDFLCHQLSTCRCTKAQHIQFGLLCSNYTSSFVEIAVHAILQKMSQQACICNICPQMNCHIP